MPRDSTYVPSNSSGSDRNEADSWSESDSVDTVVRSAPFECRGNGLLVDGFPCETPAKLKQLLKPESPGLVPILNHERPKKWWRAQCLHYGIRVPANATINTYRVYLGNAIPHQVELKRPLERIVLEEQLNRAYRDAKACGKGEVDMAPVITSKRHILEMKPNIAAQKDKRICVAGHSTGIPTQRQIGLDPPRFSYLDVLRQHELNMFIGMYNLTLDEPLLIDHSDSYAPTLIIAAGFDQLRFEGSIKFPGIISCALVFELASLSKQNECRCITVRFKWRGKVTSKEAVNVITDPSHVGQLTLDMERRQVTGFIDGSVRAEFKGTRTNSAQRELPHRWEDLDATSH